MLTLYHMAYAICPMKVRICLAEKGIEWESRVLSPPELRSPDYLALNPGGYVPTLVDGDKVITESRIISEYIDETFDGPALQPHDPFWRARMRLWTKQVDDALHPNVYVLSFVTNFRNIFLGMPADVRERMLPLDYTKRIRTLDMLEHAYDSIYVGMALKRFAKLIDDMEATLSGAPWLAGHDYSLADADMTPYLQRLTDVGVGWLWEDRPNVTDWFARVRARQSYAAVLHDWVSEEQQTQIAATAAEVEPRFRLALAA
jgi:glutathione S-transferase